MLRKRFENSQWSDGFIFQAFNLLPRTVLENVKLPLLYSDVPPESWVRWRKRPWSRFGCCIMNRAGPARRRAACIARALVLEPSVIFADEPTGADSKSGRMVIKTIQEPRSTVTRSSSSPETSTAEHALRIIRVMDGSIESDTRSRAAARTRGMRNNISQTNQIG